MFEFTTETLINSLVSGKNYSQSPAQNPTKLRIENMIFDKNNVIKITKKAPTSEYLAKVLFDMSDIVIDQAATVQEEIYRIALYIQLSMSSQDSFYANDLLYKGKPIYIEFKVKKSDSASDIAKRVVANAKNYMLVQAQEKFLNVTEENGVVTIEAVNGYQQFAKAILQKFDENAQTIDCCANQGDFVDVKVGVPAAWKINNNGTLVLLETGAAGEEKNYTIDSAGNAVPLTDDEVAIYPGLEAFGDYNWIMHNLRFPTIANTNFWSTTKHELPSVGETYTQYVITMKSNRRKIAGEAVGMEVTSVTDHVLYVASGAVSTLDSLISTIFSNITVDESAKNNEPFS